MLEGLDAIDWTAAQHAYGSATDVPGLIRSLVSPDPATRETAMGDLWSCLCHQGTVYEATALAIPFLIEALADGSNVDRGGLLILLGCMAEGASYLDVHEHPRPDPAEDPDFHENLSRELSWVRAAREAVEAGLPKYLRALDAHDRPTRAAAASVLGSCVGRADEAAEALRSALAARADETERFGLILCLGALRREADVACLRAIPADGPIGWAAAVAEADILRDRTPAATVPRIASAFADPKPLDALIDEQPWSPVDAVETARRAIKLVDDPKAVDALIAGVGRVDKRAARSLAADLLDRVLPAPHRLSESIGHRHGDPPYRPVESLDARQLAALRAIAEAGRAWGSVPDLSADLRRRDLPDIREALREYLDRR